MEKPEASENKKELNTLCETVRRLVGIRDYHQCESMICKAMAQYPHAPEPHNLIGVLLEKQGDHLKAMKHFRAAWALDPAYLPARQNLDRYGTFYSYGKSAYSESDCDSEEKNDTYQIEYDTRGIGRVVRRF